jgi:hypothetical protein
MLPHGGRINIHLNSSLICVQSQLWAPILAAAGIVLDQNVTAFAAQTKLPQIDIQLLPIALYVNSIIRKRLCSFL